VFRPIAHKPKQAQNRSMTDLRRDRAMALATLIREAAFRIRRVRLFGAVPGGAWR